MPKKQEVLYLLAIITYLVAVKEYKVKNQLKYSISKAYKELKDKLLAISILK